MERGDHRAAKEAAHNQERHLLHHINERITQMALDLTALTAAVAALQKQIADAAAATAAAEAADQAQVDAFVAGITPPAATPNSGGGPGEEPPPTPK